VSGQKRAANYNEISRQKKYLRKDRKDRKDRKGRKDMKA
jgi:hypothetical protein